jgi:hypothetical protein
VISDAKTFVVKCGDGSAKIKDKLLGGPFNFEMNGNLPIITIPGFEVESKSCKVTSYLVQMEKDGLRS